MCILFMYAPKTPHSATGSTSKRLKFVLALNRDELFSRPTKPASFWESDPDILAGQDEQEGGTWLGISKTGRICALLNVMSKRDNSNTKISRGGLVTGLLRSSPSLTGWTYCNNLYQEPDLAIRTNYNDFNFLAIDLKSAQNPTTTRSKTKEEATEASKTFASFPEVTYLTNVSGKPPEMVNFDDSSAHAFGNCVREDPFRKVTDGRQEFSDIVSKYSQNVLDDETKGNLFEEILQFLKSKEQYLPDQAIQERAKIAEISPSFLKILSSRFVEGPKELKYGTRTHTIIIVDTEDHVDYIEWTLEEPIIDTLHWKESKYEFVLSSEPTPRL